MLFYPLSASEVGKVTCHRSIVCGRRVFFFLRVATNRRFTPIKRARNGTPSAFPIIGPPLVGRHSQVDTTKSNLLYHKQCVVIGVAWRQVSSAKKRRFLST